MRWLVRSAFALIAIVAVAAIGYILIPVPPLPVRAASTAGYVDMHVHTGCIGVGDSGCFVSSSISDSYKYPFYLRAFDVTEDELRRYGDPLTLERLHEKIAQSNWVDKAVVLAMDGVITDGKLDRDLTQIYVPNEYLARELPKFRHFLFGASVNPYRPDALQRLEQVKAQGAVLIKWIPGIMYIDPADPRIIPFYDKLVELDLVLLSHAGQERSFTSSRDELGNPARLTLPLQRGVKVIAAHVASTGKNEGIDDFDRLLAMFERFPNLYADISSLTQINKLGYLSRTLAVSELHERLVFGTDWPLQFFPLVSPWYQLFRISPGQIKAIASLDNQWDRDVVLKKAMGVPEHVFERSAGLLGIR